MLTVPLIWPAVSNPVPTPELAFVHDQVKVDCWPCVMVVGLAVKAAVGGTGLVVAAATGDEDNHQCRDNNEENRPRGAALRTVHTRPPAYEGQTPDEPYTAIT